MQQAGSFLSSRGGVAGSVHYIADYYVNTRLNLSELNRLNLSKRYSRSDFRIKPLARFTPPYWMRGSIIAL